MTGRFATEVNLIICLQERNHRQGLLTDQMWGVRGRGRVKDRTYFFTLSKRNAGEVIYQDAYGGGGGKTCTKRSISDFN